jgi:hypothetical protein
VPRADGFKPGQARAAARQVVLGVHLHHRPLAVQCRASS